MDEVITTLSGPELAPLEGGDPKQLVILLHGFGSDGKDLISLAPEFANVLPHAQFVSPNAPFNCEMSPFGYQWFGLSNITDKAMFEGANDAAPILNHYIDSMLKRFGLQDKDMALIGFSQGTMMSLYTAPRYPEKLAAVLGYSGALLGEEELKTIDHHKMPIHLLHGRQDNVVPVEAYQHAQESLSALDFQVTGHTYDHLAHSINEEGVVSGGLFLKENL